MEMNVFMQKLQIRQKACYIEQKWFPVVRHFMGYPHHWKQKRHMWDCLSLETVNDVDFLFCAFR